MGEQHSDTADSERRRLRFTDKGDPDFGAAIYLNECAAQKKKITVMIYFGYSGLFPGIYTGNEAKATCGPNYWQFFNRNLENLDDFPKPWPKEASTKTLNPEGFEQDREAIERRQAWLKRIDDWLERIGYEPDEKAWESRVWGRDFTIPDLSGDGRINRSRWFRTYRK